MSDAKLAESDANINAILSFVYCNCVIAVLRNVYVRNKDIANEEQPAFL